MMAVSRPDWRNPRLLLAAANSHYPTSIILVWEELCFQTCLKISIQGPCTLTTMLERQKVESSRSSFLFPYFSTFKNIRSFLRRNVEKQESTCMSKLPLHFTMASSQKKIFEVGPSPTPRIGHAACVAWRLAHAASRALTTDSRGNCSLTTMYDVLR